MTTTRVAVPVEPTEEMLVAGARAVEDFYSCGGPYPRAKAMYRAMLSAAPAPEGGADFYKVKAAIERAMMDERDGKPCGCIIEAGCESRGYADPAYAASGFIWAATDAVMQALAALQAEVKS